MTDTPPPQPTDDEVRRVREWDSYQFNQRADQRARITERVNRDEIDRVTSLLHGHQIAEVGVVVEAGHTKILYLHLTDADTIRIDSNDILDITSSTTTTSGDPQ